MANDFLSKVKVSGGDDKSSPIHSHVEDLLRQLLEITYERLATRSLPQKHGDMSEIVLEAQVDGIRYTLTRSCPQATDLQVNLSPREREIVRLVARGHPNKIIAEILGISGWTVATHLRRIFTKLGVNSRSEMVAYVLQEGLLSDNEWITSWRH